MKKLLNKKGFTLMEMLIVIAIIVILVAISIPAFSGSLDKAKTATDAANLRAARAKVAMQLADGDTFTDLAGKAYNIKTGELVAAPATGADPSAELAGSCQNHVKAYIVVTASGDCKWSKDPADCTN